MSLPEPTPTKESASHNGIVNVRRRNDDSDALTQLTVEDLEQYFDIPAKEAASKLHIGITKLKQACRELGIVGHI